MSSLELLVVEAVTPQIRRVTFTHPAVNVVNAQAVRELHTVVDDLLADPEVRVVIFTSGTPGFYFNHAELSEIDFFRGPSDPNETGIWVDLVVKLSTAPFISIASIRGHTRGGGDEFVLAFDMRYASRENSTFGQIEVGTGLVPGGGGTLRLARLLGRDRALEAVLSADDYDAETAERYGWITRALPDAELDDFVDALAARIASFDHAAVVAAKRQIDSATLPTEAALNHTYKDLTDLIGGDGFAARASGFGAMIDAVGGEELESRLGHYIGVANQQS